MPQLKNENQKPHIVLIVPRGEAVRNFLYGDTLRCLSENARVTILTVLDDDKFNNQFKQYAEKIIVLPNIDERRIVTEFRHLLHEAHYKWLWSKVAQNVWELRSHEAKTLKNKFRLWATRLLIKLIAFRPVLEKLTKLENYLSWKLRPDNYFIRLFKDLNPDLVFNCSHIHGKAGELPVKIAHYLGIRTSGFVFSWDNLTSRSRIFVPYDHYLVWHQHMKNQLLNFYPKVSEPEATITGTPQFDYHFKEKFLKSREEFSKDIGIDPLRPFIFYTTGIDRHFPEEHRTVKALIDYINSENWDVTPQLVVRTYVKGTSQEMWDLANANIPNLIFPKVHWEENWKTPMYEDAYYYINMLRHCILGINPASTVTLELMIHQKPVINLGFDPPGSNLSHAFRWSRHIYFDHFYRLVKSNAVSVAWSKKEMFNYVNKYVNNPGSFDQMPGQDFLKNEFGNYLDGNAGKRVAEQLLKLSGKTDFNEEVRHAEEQAQKV
jgi:hypothetical protein